MDSHTDAEGAAEPRPLARKVYFSESGIEGDGRHLFRVLGSMRDEVRGILLDRHRGNNRELALVITKLEEARLWAIAYGETVGTTSVIDRREMLGGKPSA